MGRHSIPDPEDAADEPELGNRSGADSTDRGAGGGPPDHPTEVFERIRDSGPETPRRRHRYADEPDEGDDIADSDYTDYSDSDFVDEYADEYGGEYGPEYDSDTDHRYGGGGFGSEYDTGYSDEFSDDYPHDEYGYRDDYGGGAVGRRGSREDEDAETTKLSAAGGTPPPPSRPRRSRSNDGDGEWTGSHRAVESRRRGVSVGVIVALVSVVVLVAAVIVWKFVGDALSDRSETAAARCVAGELGVPVIADPTISTHIESLANRYNQSASPVGDRCVKVRVQSAESDRVVSGFANTWPSELGDRPALWIPSSSIGSARLEATAGAETVSDSRSLVTSPVLLAVSPQLKTALGQQEWTKLPELQSSPAAMDGLRLPNWGTLKLALPKLNNGDSAYLAAEAVAVSSAPSGAQPTAGMGAVSTLLGGQPELDDAELSTAFDAMLNASDPAAAPVHAVATTEQQLFQRAATLDDAASKLAGWMPQGPAAVADYPTVLLSGSWLEQEQVTAASEFARYLRKPEQLAELAKAGFRAEGTTPPDSEVTDFGPVGNPVSIADESTRVTLANATATPVSSPAVTIMLDRSMATDEGGRSRLQNVVEALTNRLKALPVTSEVGLWTFDGTEGRSEVTLGPLAEPVEGRARSEVLNSTLEDQSAAGGGAVSFTTLRLVYNEALSKFVEGRGNSVLVITTGPHTDRSLDGTGLQEFIRSTFDPARPVAVNVIDFGDDSDRDTWEAVAQASRGEYVNLPTSTAPELVTTIASMLG